MNSYDNTNGGTWGGYYGNSTDVSSMGGVPSSMNPSPPPPQQQMHAGNAGSDLQQSAASGGAMPGLMAIGPQVHYTGFGTRPQPPIDFPKHPPSIIINSLDSKR